MKDLFNKTKLLSIGICVFMFSFSYIIRINLGIPFFLILLYLCFYKKFIKIKNARLPALSFLYLISFCLGYYLIRHGLSFYFIPVAIIPMLGVLLFDNLEVAYFLSLATCISLAMLSPEPFKAVFIFMTACASAIPLVNKARKRAQIIQAGVIAGILQLISLILLEHLLINHPQRYLIILINGALSGVITLGILPLFEYLLQTVTNISLLELADSHHPVLQRMVLEAPGTYHHSLIVGNLSDAACVAVGANGLLARIGAYYHDIGKLQKPEYFIENQDIKKNAHDELTPTMSKLIIMNHIKEGLELAKKYSLSPVLWDFIQQHHG
ncbi:MAG: HDIG domain-containing metalloprotein, partial [Candidatus Omnitrophota bacterium]